jgi:endoglucanase
MTILKDLSEAFGPSGSEVQVRDVIRKAVKGHVDRMWMDALGNLHTEKAGTARRKLRILVTAHMDEVGFMVVGHTDLGTLKVETIGGIDARIMPGAQLLVGPDRIPGVIGLKPIHVLEGGERDKVTPIDNLSVDVGASKKEEAKKLAPMGTVAVFATRFNKLGPTVTGKAFDDRAGCAVLVELLRGERFPHTVRGVFTVQEEVGLRGARVAAYATEPDCAFALEGTVADDLPKDKDVSPTTELGKGPAITVMDHSFIAHRGLNQLLADTASELDIPFQFKQPGVGGTDSGAIHLARDGIPCTTVAVPCRYIHSPVSMLNLKDFDHTVHLMRETLMRIKPSTLRRE